MRTVISTSLMLAVLATSGFAARNAAAENKQLQEEVGKVEAAMPSKAPAQPKTARKLLVYSLAKGFVHDAIPLGAKTFAIMGRKTGAFEATETADPAVFTPEKLAEFDAVMMNNTTGDCLPTRQQQQALVDFVKGGKGVAGVHSATDALYGCPQYGEMMGGYFNGHPFGQISVKLDDASSPINAVFGGKGFDIADEIYTFRAPYSREKLHVLLSIDVAKSKSVQGVLQNSPKKHWQNRPDDDFALSWIHQYGQGRVFYCALGHWHQSYWNPAVLQHWLAGLQYALGDLDADATPSAK